MKNQTGLPYTRPAPNDDRSGLIQDLWGHPHQTSYVHHHDRVMINEPKFPTPQSEKPYSNRPSSLNLIGMAHAENANLCATSDVRCVAPHRLINPIN